MARKLGNCMLTSQNLFSGEVVYWSHGEWVTELSQAEIFEDEDAARPFLEAAIKDEANLVDPYLVAAKRGEKGAESTHFREAFRATGPSNYAHGKQVETQNV